MSIAAAVSSALGFLGQERTNRQNIKMSRAQMAFQERMSSSAYQRAMTDMRRAGLNPILAGKVGGASSPTGSLPNIGNAGAAAAAAAANTVSLLTQNEKLKQERMNTKRLEELNLSPMEMQYTPFNQAGSMALNQGIDLTKKAITTYKPTESKEQLKEEVMDIEDAIEDAKKRLGRKGMQLTGDERAELRKAGGYVEYRRMLLDILRRKLAK